MKERGHREINARDVLMTSFGNNVARFDDEFLLLIHASFEAL